MIASFHSPGGVVYISVMPSGSGHTNMPGPLSERLISVEILFGSLVISVWYDYHLAVLLYAISPGNKYMIGHGTNE